LITVKKLIHFLSFSFLAKFKELVVFAFVN